MRIISHYFFYEDGLTVCVRAGDAPSLCCKPNSSLPKVEDYEKCEILFLVDSPSGNRAAKLENVLQVPAQFTYINSHYDGQVVIPYSDDDTLLQIGSLLSNKKLYNEKDEVINLEDKMKDNIITCCRGCGEFDSYAIPDGIIPDGKFTCWSCRQSPYRKFKGLENKQQKEALIEYYKTY